MKKNKDKLNWYDNPTSISNLIICLTLFTIIISQSFAIKSDVSGLNLLWNVLNHNISYMILLVYFVVLKFKIGKKYFNHINVVLIIIYFISFIASIFTVFQSFSLVSLLSLAISFLLIIYLSHTLLRDTRIWSEFKLNNSPFNELSNSWYFYAITLLEIILLAVNFIIVYVFDGVVLSLLDCGLTVLFARYIYLYRVYLIKKDSKKHADGEIDTVKETVDASMDVLKTVYEDNEIDKKIEKVNEKIVEVKDKVVDKVKEVKEDINKEKQKNEKSSKDKGDK